MNAQEFVNSLSEIPNNKRVELLRGMGLPQDFITEYIESYQFKKLEGNQDNNQNPIRNLVENYNGETVKIGMITFDIVPEENEKYYFFGRFETDIFALDKTSNEIVLLDSEDLSYVIYYCAKNSSAFLDAIILGAGFLEKLPYDDELLENQNIICEIATQCSNLGGGNKYLDFYKTLLGCNA